MRETLEVFVGGCAGRGTLYKLQTLRWHSRRCSEGKQIGPIPCRINNTRVALVGAARGRARWDGWESKFIHKYWPRALNHVARGPSPLANTDSLLCRWNTTNCFARTGFGFHFWQRRQSARWRQILVPYFGITVGPQNGLSGARKRWVWKLIKPNLDPGTAYGITESKLCQPIIINTKMQFSCFHLHYKILNYQVKWPVKPL